MHVPKLLGVDMIRSFVTVLSVSIFSVFVVASAVFILIILLFVFTEDGPREPHPSASELEVMAHDVYVVIAGQTIRVPLLAIYGVRGSRYLCSENNNETEKIPCVVSKEKILAMEPIVFNQVDISLENYSHYFDGDLYSYNYPELCPILSQEWARQICKGRYRGFLGPQRFSLVEKKYLSSFNNIWLSNGGLGEMVQKMSLEGKIPSSYCRTDEKGNPPGLCAAGMQVGDNLLAAWVVTRAGAEKPRIARDAQIIRALLKYGMGETENFKLLNAVLQEY